MTYKRLKAALEQIAAGDGDPVAVAKEALRSRAVAAKPKPAKPGFTPAEEIHARKMARLVAIAELRIAGASYKEIADRYGVSRHRAYQLCGNAKRMFRHPNWRDHPIAITGHDWIHNDERG